MSTEVSIFYPELKQLVGDELRLEGTTVGELLGDLVHRFPDAQPLLFDGNGGLRRLVHVFVNQEGMRKADSDQPVKEGDRLIIAVLACGG